MSLSLLIGGCQKGSEALLGDSENPDEHHDHTTDVEGHDHDQHESEHERNHDHQAIAMTTYECGSKQIIEAHYAAPAEKPTDIPADENGTHLLIDGIQYDLTPSPVVASSAISSSTTMMSYETEYGINDNAGLIW
ncbi:hypothetical protein [Psychrobacter sp. CAL346-MNA-CIBAN-0220]|uniref:hypothetical protein n=1 Tax=Psychrobacter sp. CAL346-MNA-CIBAN-0220 TaxID=3140457 RepID=UPI00332C1CE6